MEAISRFARLLCSFGISEVCLGTAAKRVEADAMWCASIRRLLNLRFFWQMDDYFSMSSRETVIEFVRTLPEEMPLAEIARKIELLAGIQTAREQARRNEGIQAQEARKLVDSRASK
jgi:hypothetical protein